MSERSAILTPLREQLDDRGFFVVEQALGEACLHALDEVSSDEVLANEVRENKYFGSPTGFTEPSYREPAIVDMLTCPKAMAALGELGYPDPKLHTFYGTSKRPGAVAMKWHADIYYREGLDQLTEVFMLYYTQAVDRHNGCLRVIPGSHLWTPDERRKATGTADARPDEEAIPMQAGDVFIGDRRLMHATYANNSSEWRRGFSAAYVPAFEGLSRSLRRMFAASIALPPIESWDVEGPDRPDERLRPLKSIFKDN